MSVCLYSCLSYPACAVLYCHLWSVWLYHIFPHYLINGTILGNKVIEHKMCVSLPLLSETFLILRRIHRDIIMNVHRPLCKVPVILVRCYWNLKILDRFSKNTQITNYIKIRPVERSCSMRTERRTDRQTDIRNSCFSPFCERAQKTKELMLYMETIVVHSDTHIKHTNIIYGKNAELLNFNLVVLKVSTKL